MSQQTVASVLNDPAPASADATDYMAWLNSPLWMYLVTVLVGAFSLSSEIALMVFPGVAFVDKAVRFVVIGVSILSCVAYSWVEIRATGRILMTCRVRGDFHVLLFAAKPVATFASLMVLDLKRGLGVLHAVESLLVFSVLCWIFGRGLLTRRINVHEQGVQLGFLFTWDQIVSSYWKLSREPVLVLSFIRGTENAIPVAAGDVHELDEILRGHLPSHESLPEEARLED